MFLRLPQANNAYNNQDLAASMGMGDVPLAKNSKSQNFSARESTASTDIFGMLRDSFYNLTFRARGSSLMGASSNEMMAKTIM